VRCTQQAVYIENCLITAPHSEQPRKYGENRNANIILKEITVETLLPYRKKLENHPVYKAVESSKDLRYFMEHHVYSVWDFMSLLKYLQSVIAPAQYPWVPMGDASVRRFINELVLEEESDQTHVEGEFSSHFELYQRSMLEIGADTDPIADFVSKAETQGVEVALKLPSVPPPSARFTSTTFQLIKEGKPHKVAAAFALGREHIIPCMFRSILKETGVSDRQAPIFHFYLNRHVDLDEGSHAPLSLRLLNGLCDHDETKVREAIDAAKLAISARLELWDGVLESINKPEQTLAVNSFAS
jgi:hypothetical protein